MKEIKMFMAEDGKMFDTMIECVEYEESVPTEDKLCTLRTYSNQDDCVKLKNIEDVKDFLEDGRPWIQSIIEDTWYGF